MNEPFRFPLVSGFYHCHRSQSGCFYIIPASGAFALWLVSDFLGLYETAELAAEAASSGKTRIASPTTDLLRLGAPSQIERWAKLSLAQAFEQSHEHGSTRP